MSVEPGVVDANVLVYAVNVDAPQHLASRALLEIASAPSNTLYVTSRILCEFYSVITNSRRVSAPVSPGEGLRAISALLALPGVQVLPVPTDTVVRWMELLVRRPVIGGGVFDLQLIATMEANNVLRIYTFNVEDFEVFPELTAVVPKG